MTTPPSIEAGQRLKELRMKHGLRQRDVADIFSIPLHWVSAYEHGKGASGEVALRMIERLEAANRVEEIAPLDIELKPLARQGKGKKPQPKRSKKKKPRPKRSKPEPRCLTPEEEEAAWEEFLKGIPH